MPEYKDYPITEILESFKRLKPTGAVCFQKFTCAGCGARLTMDVPFALYIEGSCDKCDTITNIEKQGCNFAMIRPLSSKGADATRDMFGE